ncbi:hypothetical protein PV327_002880 [Microctonus hyperodae]|uniref:Uncharacterized protein n=1 Tax=Microctonus hyperodae TaxID=165561 RepID=A0AA39KPN0_MICHY|nr:hypothetical protein PV327_002880 [Microctonus hyperodae]
MIIISNKLVSNQLIRPNYIYEEISQGIHDYYDSTCIIFLHAVSDPVESQDIEVDTMLRNLVNHFAQKHVRILVMEIKTFIAKVLQNYYNIKRPLFVFLNDFDDVKYQFGNLVAPLIDLSYPNWLIFFREETKIEDFFQHIYIPFDCTFMISQPNSQCNNSINAEIIWEAYQIDRAKEVRSGIFATWNSETGIQLPKYTDGTWTGGIASLIDNTSDIFAAELMMTSDRVSAITFTTPLYSTKCRTYIKRPSTSSLKWNAYVIPFTSGIWGAIILVILITGGVMSGIKFLALMLQVSKVTMAIEPVSFLNTIFTVFGALCSQGMASSIFDPIRIVHISIHLTGVILIAAYSGALISSLAVKTFSIPFTTMEGLLKDGTYRFGVVGASADFTFFQNTSDKVMSVLFEKVLVKENHLPTNYLEGLSRVCKEDKYAFMTLDNVVSQLQSSLDCIVLPLNIISQTSIGIALQPHSPYRGLIDSNILLYRDSGVLQRLLNDKWSRIESHSKSVWSTVEITDVLPLIIVLICGGFTSFILLATEKLLFQKLTKNKQEKFAKRFITNVKYPLPDKYPMKINIF